jgi:hypothetical protein
VFLKWVFAIFDFGLSLSVGCGGFVVGEEIISIFGKGFYLIKV